MPLAKIQLRPGINIELTPTANEGSWSSSQLIRFFAGQLQKLGGWARIAGIDTLKGQCRGLFGWADLVGTGHLAAGTNERLYVLTGGVLADVTPIVHTSNLAPGMATLLNSATVTITDATFGPAAGDWVNIVTPISQGGTTVSGSYQVVAVPGPTTYQITADRAATATTPTGGAVPVFTATLGSAVVAVQLSNNGFVAGGAFSVPISMVIAGLTLFGKYTIASVLDASNFTIIASALASVSVVVAMNSGNMQIAYLLPSGAPINQSLAGWGTGDWGAGDWGTGSAGRTSTLVRKARTWSLDHFGQDLIASPDLGAIYHWAPPAAPSAVVLSATAPIINKVVLTVAQAQIIVACGSEAGGTFFPTLIRWCDSGDFTDWLASATNQAGSYQLPSGSYVTSALAVGLGALIWTDVDLWAMTYQGLPFVFGLNQIAVNCEALSKKAPAVIGNSVVWPSQRGFYRYTGGGVAPMACPVWDLLYTRLDPNQLDLVCSAVNTLFNEVAWYFPVRTGEIFYVKWNYLENTWDIGDLTRTAWVDHSPYDNPVGADENGVLYVHETSADADGAPMGAFAQSGYYDLQDGNDLVYVNTIIPDFLASAGSALQMTILAVDYPGDTPRHYGPYTINPTTRRINVSLRGRQIAFRIGSEDLGSSWRMGAVRYSAAAAGRRP
jgi:hypothetical protein